MTQDLHKRTDGQKINLQEKQTDRKSARENSTEVKKTGRENNNQKQRQKNRNRQVKNERK